MYSPGLTIFEATEARPGDKRKREKPGDPGDIEGYKGKEYKERATYIVHSLRNLLWNIFFEFVINFYHNDYIGSTCTIVWYNN